jgi:heat shock protein HslJ
MPNFKTLLLSLFSLLLLSACFEPEPNTALKNTHWALIQMKNENVEHFEHQPQVHLVFHLNDSTFHGSDGCNRIHGKYTKDRNNFTMDEIASTRMMCKAGMKQSNEFLHILTETDRIKIVEDNLILYHADIPIARFEAVETH